MTFDKFAQRVGILILLSIVSAFAVTAWQVALNPELLAR